MKGTPLRQHAVMSDEGGAINVRVQNLTPRGAPIHAEYRSKPVARHEMTTTSRLGGQSWWIGKTSTQADGWHSLISLDVNVPDDGSVSPADAYRHAAAALLRAADEMDL